MATIYDLKPKFQGLLRPSIQRLARLGFTPNAITLIALAGSLAVGGALVLATRWRAILLLLPVWLFARMALNAIDGMMAKELSMASKLGAVLNEVGDVVSDLALYLPLAFLHEPSRWAIVAFAIGAVLTEFCGVTGQALGASRHYEGPMGKSDRAFVMGALGLITYFVPKACEFWIWVFAIAAALTAFTCVNRLSKALKEIQPKP